MIALAIGLLVVLGATNVFLANKQSYRTNVAIGQIQDNARVAFELLMRDLRQARLSGCSSQASVNNQINVALPWYADFVNKSLIGYASDTSANPALTTGTSSGNQVANTESINLLGADDFSYTVSAVSAPNTTSRKITVAESSPQLAVGDLTILCDTSSIDIAQITSKSSADYVLATGTTTPGNAAVLSKNYPVNSQISRLKSVSWYIGCNPVTASGCAATRGGTSLYRASVVGTTGPGVSTQIQEMVRGVASMNLLFHKVGDTAFSTAHDVGTDWGASVVDAVRVTLRLVAEDRGSEKGAIYSTTDAYQNNSVIYRDLNATLRLRNPP